MPKRFLFHAKKERLSETQKYYLEGYETHVWRSKLQKGHDMYDCVFK